MKFFSKFVKRKKDDLTTSDLTAMVSGQLIKIEDVKDEVFSQKMMGDGIAIIPTEGKILAPASGKITSVYPTGHAVNLSLDIGVDAIIHIGIDTVELKGKGFTKKVSNGQKVGRGDILIELDRDLISSEVDLTTMLIFPELHDWHLEKESSKSKVIAGRSIVGRIKNKE